MAGDKEIQLARIVDSHDYARAFTEVSRIYSLNYPGEPSEELKRAYEQTRRLFEGEFSGYRACNSEYHDLRHTLDVVLATARLADGYNLRRPPLPEVLVLDLLRASFLHDTGYIQEQWDTEGTGAKYARQHEQRSIEFLKRHHAAFAIPAAELDCIIRLIQSTDLKMAFSEIPFASPQEQSAGAILGTADLIGQMGDREYLEKLLFLYYEFKEAGIPGFETEFDVLRKTGDFFGATKQRMKDSYLGMYNLARAHFKARYNADCNLYLLAINRQMNYLRKIIQDESTNFRHKLKRGDQKRLQQLSQRPWLNA